MIKPLCSKCGNAIELYRLGKQRYCLSCHNRNMRNTRPKYSELSDDEKKKSNARAYLKEYVRRGIVKKHPCEVCGNEKSEGHHLNYKYPLVVKWLCKKHHIELHKNSVFT